jgi:hypothetical protein
MAYVATNPSSFAGQVVGTGHCVPFVQAAAHAPPTSSWTEGVVVRGAAIATGTVIATFQEGAYQNRLNGDSHAAIYVSQNEAGLLVWDQWKGQPVHQRTIRFKGGQGTPNNDGDAYHVVE